MHTTTATTIEAIFTITDDDQHFETFNFDHRPSEAEVIHALLSRLDRDQLRSLVKISICQLDTGDPLPWLADGKYHFHR